MPAEILVPDVAVTVNGRPLPAAARSDIFAVEVHESIDTLSMFTIELGNWDRELLKVSWSDDPLFAVGSAVSIKLGYVDDLSTVMTGEITGLEPSFDSDRSPRLTVRGYDQRHRLGRGTKSRAFANLKDSAIVSSVALDYGLRTQVEDTGAAHPLVIQDNQSDLAFLRGRADLNGFDCYVQDGVLHFHPPLDTAAPTVTLDAIQDLKRFSPRLSTLSQTGSSSVRAWDPKAKTAIVATVTPGDVPVNHGTAGMKAADQAFGLTTAQATLDVPVDDAGEAGRLARSRYVQRAGNYVRGEGECGGRPSLRAGQVVRVTGAGKTFSGPYYLTAVTHSFFRNDSYRTAFDVRSGSAG